MAVDVLLGLSAAVVKVSCKIWLRDNSFAANASTDVVDVIREKVSGELDQRKARRLFEDLEEPVAAKLEHLREHELAGMPDNEWEAAVLSVGDTLRRARFTDRDVFAGDLDPLYLRRKIASGSPLATRDLSEAATEVYGRLLTECCAYVVELTATLPRFVPGAFAEVLRRQSVILSRFAEVLDRLPTADDVLAGVRRAEADFTAAYRRQLVSQLDRLELFGVTLSDSVRGYPLSAAYIPLSVCGNLQQGQGLLPGDISRLPGGYSELSPRIGDVLAGTSRLFLRGEAGSGKTTLLQWLAVRAARQDFPDRLETWNGLVPFFIRLRRFVGSHFPAPESFVDEVGRHISAEMPGGWVHAQLRAGRALLLVDGVDELPEAQRRPAREWLSTLIGTFPDTRYVVTSRPGAAAATWLDAQAFDTAEIQPMGWPDVLEFVRHWHAALRADSADSDRRDQLSASETALLDVLHARRHLRLLATSPLLCALICALNLDRRAHLPDERMELYAIALDMLLERRDAERLAISPDEPQLSKTVKILLLEDLAYWLVRSGWSDAPRDRVVGRMSRRLAVLPHAGTSDGSATLDALIVRSGLIREPVAGRVDFVHRTFEEYLAAGAAVKDDEMGELIRNAHDDQWREVIVMAAGHSQPRQGNELIRGILVRAEDEPDKRYLLQTLAVACQETLQQPDPQLHTEIQSVAESLLPPRGIRQAEVLANIGEPLLDLLAQRPARGTRQAAATIRAASLVGGQTALQTIARYAHFAGEAVLRELNRAWQFFDVEEYASTVLAQCPAMSTVIIDTPNLIPGLRHIPQLNGLLINFHEGYGNLGFVRELPAISYLNIMRDPLLWDLSPLAGHEALEILLLQGDGRSVDLTPLSSLPQLRSIFFEAHRAVNFEVLRECPVLDEISIVGLDDSDYLLDVLPTHPLRRIRLEGCSWPQDISALPEVPELAELESLQLVHSACTSIHGIQRWARTLRTVLLAGKYSYDLAPLTQLPQLDDLTLAFEAAKDLRVIRELAALRNLWLRDVTPVDLTELRGVRSLNIHVENTKEVLGADLLGERSQVIGPQQPVAPAPQRAK